MSEFIASQKNFSNSQIKAKLQGILLKQQQQHQNLLNSPYSEKLEARNRDYNSNMSENYKKPEISPEKFTLRSQQIDETTINFLTQLSNQFSTLFLANSHDYQKYLEITKPPAVYNRAQMNREVAPGQKQEREKRIYEQKRIDNELNFLFPIHRNQDFVSEHNQGFKQESGVNIDLFKHYYRLFLKNQFQMQKLKREKKQKMEELQQQEHEKTEAEDQLNKSKDPNLVGGEEHIMLPTQNSQQPQDLNQSNSQNKIPKSLEISIEKIPLQIKQFIALHEINNIELCENIIRLISKEYEFRQQQTVNNIEPGPLFSQIQSNEDDKQKSQLIETQQQVNVVNIQTSFSNELSSEGVAALLRIEDIFINQIIRSSELYGVASIDPRDYADFKQIVRKRKNDLEEFQQAIELEKLIEIKKVFQTERQQARQSILNQRKHLFKIHNQNLYSQESGQYQLIDPAPSQLNTVDEFKRYTDLMNLQRERITMEKTLSQKFQQNNNNINKDISQDETQSQTYALKKDFSGTMDETQQTNGTGIISSILNLSELKNVDDSKGNTSRNQFITTHSESKKGKNQQYLKEIVELDELDKDLEQMSVGEKSMEDFNENIKENTKKVKHSLTSILRAFGSDELDKKQEEILQRVKSKFLNMFTSKQKSMPIMIQGDMGATASTENNQLEKYQSERIIQLNIDLFRSRDFETQGYSAQQSDHVVEEIQEDEHEEGINMIVSAIKQQQLHLQIKELLKLNEIKYLKKADRLKLDAESEKELDQFGEEKSKQDKELLLLEIIQSFASKMEDSTINDQIQHRISSQLIKQKRSQKILKDQLTLRQLDLEKSQNAKLLRSEFRRYSENNDIFLNIQSPKSFEDASKILKTQKQPRQFNFEEVNIKQEEAEHKTQLRRRMLMLRVFGQNERETIMNSTYTLKQELKALQILKKRAQEQQEGIEVHATNFKGGDDALDQDLLFLEGMLSNHKNENKARFEKIQGVTNAEKQQINFKLNYNHSHPKENQTATQTILDGEETNVRKIIQKQKQKLVNKLDGQDDGVNINAASDSSSDDENQNQYMIKYQQQNSQNIHHPKDQTKKSLNKQKDKNQSNYREQIEGNTSPKNNHGNQNIEKSNQQQNIDQDQQSPQSKVEQKEEKLQYVETTKRNTDDSLSEQQRSFRLSDDQVGISNHNNNLLEKSLPLLRNQKDKDNEQTVSNEEQTSEKKKPVLEKQNTIKLGEEIETKQKQLLVSSQKFDLQRPIDAIGEENENEYEEQKPLKESQMRDSALFQQPEFQQGNNEIKRTEERQKSSFIARNSENPDSRNDTRKSERDQLQRLDLNDLQLQDTYSGQRNDDNPTPLKSDPQLKRNSFLPNPEKEFGQRRPSQSKEAIKEQITPGIRTSSISNADGIFKSQSSKIDDQFSDTKESFGNQNSQKGSIVKNIPAPVGIKSVEAKQKQEQEALRKQKQERQRIEFQNFKKFNFQEELENLQKRKLGLKELKEEIQSQIRILGNDLDDQAKLNILLYNQRNNAIKEIQGNIQSMFENNLAQNYDISQQLKNFYDVSNRYIKDNDQSMKFTQEISIPQTKGESLLDDLQSGLDGRVIDQKQIQQALKFAHINQDWMMIFERLQVFQEDTEFLQTLDKIELQSNFKINQKSLQENKIIEKVKEDSILNPEVELSNKSDSQNLPEEHISQLDKQMDMQIASISSQQIVSTGQIRTNNQIYRVYSVEDLQFQKMQQKLLQVKKKNPDNFSQLVQLADKVLVESSDLTTIIENQLEKHHKCGQYSDRHSFNSSSRAYQDMRHPSPGVFNATSDRDSFRNPGFLLPNLTTHSIFHD